MDYNSIISAIPKKWIKMLENDKNSPHYLVFKECTVYINKQRKKLEEVSTKDIYLHLIEQIAKRPTSENKWQEKVRLNFDDNMWANVYKLPYMLTWPRNIIALHFKIADKIVTCNYHPEI